MKANILRALLGASMGLIYGQLLGELTLAGLRLTYDPAHPGALIGDKNGWARLIAFAVTVLASVFGVLAGVVVGLTRETAARGALMGAGIGICWFLVFVVLDLLDIGNRLMRDPGHVWPILLSHIAMFLVIFPIGMGLVGLATGFIATKLRLSRRQLTAAITWINRLSTVSPVACELRRREPIMPVRCGALV